MTAPMPAQSLAQSLAQSPARMLRAGKPLTLSGIADGAEGLVIADLARAIAAGASPPAISMAVSAIIPVEALCDSPGIGQLVWQSAAARDLPVLLQLEIVLGKVINDLAMLVAHGREDIDDLHVGRKRSRGAGTLG